jgi:hypothetical protein
MGVLLEDKKKCQRCLGEKRGVRRCEVTSFQPFAIDYCKECRGIVARNYSVTIIDGEREKVAATPAPSAKSEEKRVKSKTPPPAGKGDGGDELDGLNVKALRVLAVGYGLELPGKAKKGEIVAAIRAYEEEQATAHAASTPPVDSGSGAGMTEEGAGTTGAGDDETTPDGGDGGVGDQA